MPWSPLGRSVIMENMTIETDVRIPQMTFDAHGELAIAPSPTSSQHDFDFFAGKWKLRNRRLRSRLVGCTDWDEFDSTQEMYQILGGIGNIDNFLATFDGQPFEGMTVRLFNPNTRLWSIYWADSAEGRMQPPVVGSFVDRIGHFFTKDTHNERQVITVFRWDARDPHAPVWSQAMTPDNGQTWEWNWFMYMTRMN